MQTIKILYVANEIVPFLETSTVASYVRTLSQSISNSPNFEVRIIVPRFGPINQRKNSIHEILRLSGINIPMGKQYISLVGKIASIKGAGLQVYFVDNEELFDDRKGIFSASEDKVFYPDNDLRMVFFCKSVFAIVKKLDWMPHIIHCHDWFSSFIPLYLKTTYASTLSNTRSIYTVYPSSFQHTFTSDLFQIAKLREVKPEHLAPIRQANLQGFTDLATTYADFTTFAFHPGQRPTNLELSHVGGGHIPNQNDETFITQYQILYQNLYNAIE